MNTWILQADPDQFRIDEFLATAPEACLWRASTGQSKMRVDGIVYLWRSIGTGDRGRAGVVAKAEIGSSVAELRDDTASKEFWIKRIDVDTIYESVEIRIKCVGRHIPYDT